MAAQVGIFPAKEETSTLQEIQRLDYERERKERQAREVQDLKSQLAR